MTKEADIQIACNDYLTFLSNTYTFRHFHVPNEGKRSIYYHAKMKRMGLKSGCPDIIVEYRRNYKHRFNRIGGAFEKMKSAQGVSFGFGIARLCHSPIINFRK